MIETQAASAQSCTLIPFSPDIGGGSISGFVLDGRPLCYFLDWTHSTGTARLISDNACLVADGLADCSRVYDFAIGANGLSLFVHQDRLQANHARFTLDVALH